MIDLDYPKLLKLFPAHIAPERSESASFLIWYLENYYRLEALQATDCVCDQKGDKGIDGIYVNDDAETITILQSKILQNSAKRIGDTPLKEFVGTLSQFKDQKSLQTLISSAGEAKVAQLINRLGLTSKIGAYEVRGEFVANVNLDKNGSAYLKSHPKLTFIGKDDLTQRYISKERTPPIQKQATFDINGLDVCLYSVDTKTRTIIAPIKAKELVKINGIADQSVFTFNVRGYLSNTKVNKDIIKTIKTKSEHRQFPLFHNGITIITGSLKKSSTTITMKNYFVVNGCQSLRDRLRKRIPLQLCS